MFGYDEGTWETGEDVCPPEFCDASWEDLTAEQQSAARVFGYDEEEWTSPVWECPEDTLVATNTWDDYWWSELPPCVQDAGEL